MEVKTFEANQELQDYLLSQSFEDISLKVFPNKPSKKAFRRKRMFLYFDYINISISRKGEIIYRSPQIEKSKLNELFDLAR